VFKNLHGEDCKLKKLKDVGERWITRYINSTLREKVEKLSRLSVGDDAIDIPSPQKILVAIDMMVEETDIPRGISWRDVGYRAVTSTTSDIAAKGGKPIAYLVSLGLPPNMLLQDFEELWKGIIEAAEIYGGVVVGGDTNTSSKVIIDVVCIAEPPQRLVSRSGARVGDIVAVTGLFGSHSAGLHALLNNIEDDTAIKAIEKMLRPVARIKEGRVLSEYATSCIDSSDGLAESLYILSESSNIGFRVDHPPIDVIAEKYSEKHSVDLLDLVFYGGEEYELVVTIKPEVWEEACREIEEVGGRLIKIGHVIDEPGKIYVRWGGEFIELRKRGYTHFLESSFSR